MTCNLYRVFFRHKAEATLPQRKRIIFPPGWLLPLWLLSLVAMPVAAVTVETQLRHHIEQELALFLQQRGVQAQQQDIQLTLPGGLTDNTCDMLQISRRQQQEPPLGRVSYTLSCDSPRQWQSRATAQVALWLELVVASRTLERDEVLTDAMLGMQSIDIGKLRHGLEFNRNDLLGMTVKRRIDAGSPVSRHLLQPAWLVQKGAQVTLQFSGDGFAISTKGQALSNGGLGEKISVQNLSSGKVLDATVVGEDLVETGNK